MSTRLVTHVRNREHGPRRHPGAGRALLTTWVAGYPAHRFSHDAELEALIPAARRLAPGRIELDLGLSAPGTEPRTGRCRSRRRRWDALRDALSALADGHPLAAMHRRTGVGQQD
jgi:hypothetical protein